MASPFVGDTHLAPALVLDDLFQGKLQPVTWSEAMSVPTWKRARDLVCTVLARQPLRVYAQGVPLPSDSQPRFLTTSRYFPVRLRTLWTLDDIAHYGRALWTLDRGAADSSGRRAILDACRIPPHQWRVDSGRIVITVDGKDHEIPEDGYLLFVGQDNGLLTTASDTIRAAKNLERQWQDRVRKTIPLVEIRYTGEDTLDEDEMREIRNTFIKARNDPDGTVMVTPAGFEVHTALAGQDVNFFVEGRNAVSLDVARFWDIPASMLDASQVNGSSVDYENNAIGRSAYYDLTLRSWATPIEEALSQDDVLPRGQYVAFDLSALTTNPDTGSGPVQED